MQSLSKDKAMDIAIFHDLGGNVTQVGFILKLIGLHRKYEKMTPNELAKHIRSCCNVSVKIKEDK